MVRRRATIRSMFKEEDKKLDGKKARLESIIDEAGSAVVAYSGGVDSTLLAHITHQRLGDRMLAVTAESATYPDFQLGGPRHSACGDHE
jgi:PP-loop superfamily ATP-utilizing enzyme